jgi:hypothetical protein
MRRLHLFEFLDQSWLPQVLREAATRYLTAACATTPFPALWARILVRTLDQCGLERIVDIGSGSGGPMELVLTEMAKLGCRPRVTLTDLYPVQTSGLIDYWPTPVSAARVPLKLGGLRTLFTTFHHFSAPMARAVLEDAFTQRQPICIFEATSRTGLAIAFSLFIPFLVLILTPSVRPLSMSQLFFTYLIPVIPLIAFWDGLVSQLRTYSLPELQALTANFNSPDFVWEYGVLEASRVPFKAGYLIGRATKAADLNE